MKRLEDVRVWKKAVKLFKDFYDFVNLWSFAEAKGWSQKRGHFKSGLDLDR